MEETLPYWKQMLQINLLVQEPKLEWGLDWGGDENMLEYIAMQKHVR